MAKFFINRPIVAIVISILMVIARRSSRWCSCPSRCIPNIAPPEILVQATYVGADALTLEQSVATPIEQQMSGVDNMIYMYSINASSGGQMSCASNFDVATDPNTDQMLAQMRYSQAASQLPPEVKNYGVTRQEVRHEPARAVRALLAEGHLRPAVPRQLRLHQHQRPDDARAGHRPGADLRRRPVRDAASG